MFYEEEKKIDISDEATLSMYNIKPEDAKAADKDGNGVVKIVSKSVQDEAGKYLWLEFWDKIKEIATPSEELLETLRQIAVKAGEVWAGWQEAWYIFAGFALVVSIAFWIFFPKTPANKDIEVKH